MEITEDDFKKLTYVLRLGASPEVRREAIDAGLQAYRAVIDEHSGAGSRPARGMRSARQGVNWREIDEDESGDDSAGAPDADSAPVDDSFFDFGPRPKKAARPARKPAPPPEPEPEAAEEAPEEPEAEEAPSESGILQITAPSAECVSLEELPSHCPAAQSSDKVGEMIKAGVVIPIKKGDQWVFPLAQFDSNGNPHPCIKEAVIASHGNFPLAWEWLTTPNDSELNGHYPISLAETRHAGLLIDAIQNHLAPLAQRTKTAQAQQAPTQ